VTRPRGGNCEKRRVFVSLPLIGTRLGIRIGGACKGGEGKERVTKKSRNASIRRFLEILGKRLPEMKERILL